MIVFLVFSVFQILCRVIILAENVENGSPCITPNNELATCVEVKNCPVILDAVKTNNAAALDFLKQSQCSYTGQYMVCCGTTGRRIETKESTEQIIVDGSPCTTPNQEQGTCQMVEKCPVLIDDIGKASNEYDLDFIRKSKCAPENDRRFMVCCGSTGRRSASHNPLIMRYFLSTDTRGEQNTKLDTTIPTNVSEVTHETNSKKQAITCVNVSSDAINTTNEVALSFVRKWQYPNTQFQLCHDDVPIYEHPLLPNSSVCGIQVGNFRMRFAKTDLGEFPWMAILKYELNDGSISYENQGTLISQRYVLSSAQVTLGAPRKTLIGVRLGEYNTTTNPDCKRQNDLTICADPVLDIGIERVINHELFSISWNRYLRRAHDICLIRLERDIEFTNFIRPICLPSETLALPVSTNLTFAGWGRTAMHFKSKIKVKVVLPVTNSTECAAIFRQELIPETQFCAGGNAGEDTCSGDAGGSGMRIVRKDPQQWVQEGIVSWGKKHCGIAGQPGGYTKVSKYIDWIIRNMTP